MEMGTVGDDGIRGGGDRRFKVPEVNGGEGLRNVEISGFAVEAGAVPVKDAVGRVAVLLDLDDHQSLSDGMEPPAGEKEALSGAYGNPVEGLLDGPLGQSLLKGFAGDAALEAGVDAGSLRGMEKLPAFGLGLRGCDLRDLFGRVNLNGEAFTGIEKFEKKGKTGRGVCGVERTEDPLPLPGPEIVEGKTLQRAVMDDALRLGPVNQLPGLSHHGPVGKFFPEKGFQTSSSPDPFHGKGLK